MGKADELLRVPHGTIMLPVGSVLSEENGDADIQEVPALPSPPTIRRLISDMREAIGQGEPILGDSENAYPFTDPHDEDQMHALRQYLEAVSKGQLTINVLSKEQRAEIQSVLPPKK